METKTDKTIAMTILHQLGGNRFIAMTGAKNLSCNNDALMFMFPKNKTCWIILDEDDTYSMRFFKLNWKLIDPLILVSEHHGIYCDQLQNIFTKQTGLDCNL